MRDLKRALSYDEVAAAYDQGRPGYPDALFDELVRLSGIPEDGRILEIGCGTGQATRPLAARGYRITCIELGGNLAALARRNLAGFPKVEIRNEDFETAVLEPESFDLVMAAVSLHHISGEVRYAGPARLLKSGGALAVIGNHPGADDPGFRADLDRIYSKWWGEKDAMEYAKTTLEQRIANGRREIEESGLFGPVEVRQHPHRVEYDSDRYVKLLRSDSSRLQHSAEVNEGHRADIAAAIARRGGRVNRGFTATLYLAKKPG